MEAQLLLPQSIPSNPFVLKGRSIKNTMRHPSLKAGVSVGPRHEKYTPPEGMLGGWTSTSVIDCKNAYWIYVASDSGPYLYGPFEKKVGRI